MNDGNSDRRTSIFVTHLHWKRLLLAEEQVAPLKQGFGLQNLKLSFLQLVQLGQTPSSSLSHSHLELPKVFKHFPCQQSCLVDFVFGNRF